MPFVGVPVKLELETNRKQKEGGGGVVTSSLMCRQQTCNFSSEEMQQHDRVNRMLLKMLPNFPL